jgi:hypothetical protein
VGDGTAFPFLITADHVLDLVEGDSIWVRMNLRSGGCDAVKIKKGNGRRDYKSDVAVLSLDADFNLFDCQAVALDRAEFGKQRAKWEWDIGDEVAILGLYGTHFGQLKNVPVTRIGHISLMPGEPVISHRGEIVAYLVEGKSISGLSGSPVFVNAPQVKIDNGRWGVLTGPLLIPMGMVLGYHSVESKEDQISVPEMHGENVEDDAPPVDRNTGLTTVVPFEAILDMVEHGEIASAMKSATERRNT